MLSLFLIFCLFRAAESGIADANCTTTDSTGTVFAESAVNCDNYVDDNVCATLLPTAAASPIVAGGTTDRVDACFKTASPSAPSEAQKQAVIKTCPKLCGYCCLTPPYNCPNKQFPAVDCKTVKKSQCNEVRWRQILATECPNVCGLCQDGGCVDANIECANDISICRNIDMQEFVKVNCQKTCGFCTNASGSSTTTMFPGGACVDKGTNCASWFKNGFCISNFYTTAQKMQYCAATCGLCNIG